MINGSSNVPKESKGVSADLLKADEFLALKRELDTAKEKIKKFESEVTE